MKVSGNKWAKKLSKALCDRYMSYMRINKGTGGIWLKHGFTGWTLFKTVPQVSFPSFFWGVNVCANPAGHTATPHCFAHLAKLKSVKEVKFFPLHTPAFLPFGWQLLTWHMCITFLSIISAMTAALTLHRHRGPSMNLCSSLGLSKRIWSKSFLITERNNFRWANFIFPFYSLHVLAINGYRWFSTTKQRSILN